jgi:hypothetical protein
MYSYYKGKNVSVIELHINKVRKKEKIEWRI